MLASNCYPYVDPEEALFPTPGNTKGKNAKSQTQSYIAVIMAWLVIFWRWLSGIKLFQSETET
jgi:hypothetical protein